MCSRHAEPGAGHPDNLPKPLTAYIEDRILLHQRSFDSDTPTQDRERLRAEAKIAELYALLAYIEWKERLAA